MKHDSSLKERTARILFCESIHELAIVAQTGGPTLGYVRPGRRLGTELASVEWARPKAMTTDGAFVVAARETSVDVFGPGLEVVNHFTFAKSVTDVAVHRSSNLMVAMGDQVVARKLRGSAQLLEEWADGGVHRSDSEIASVHAVGSRVVVVKETGVEILDADGRIEAEYPCAPGPLSQWDNSIAVASDGKVREIGLATGRQRSADIGECSGIALGPRHIFLIGTRHGECTLTRLRRGQPLKQDGRLTLPRPARCVAATENHTYVFDGASSIRIRHDERMAEDGSIELTEAGTHVDFEGPSCAGVTAAYAYGSDGRLRSVSLGERGFLASVDLEDGNGPGVPFKIAQ